MTAIALDVETTGLNPNEERILEICIIDFDSEETLLHTLINPGRPISAEITAINRIDDVAVKDAPPWEQINDQVCEIIRSAEIVIGYNVFFDRGFICAEVVRCKGELTFPKVLCPKRLWDLHEPKRNLTSPYKRFVDRAGFTDAHGALPDTMAVLKVLKKQREEFGLVDKAWEDYDPEQKLWWGPSNHVIWKEDVLLLNFGKHAGTPIHLVDRSYWRWLLSQTFPEHVMVLAEYVTLVARPGITAQELASWAYGRRI